MNEIIEKEIINIKDMIYEIDGVEVMLDSELSASKWHDFLIDKIITHYDIGKPTSVRRYRRKMLW